MGVKMKQVRSGSGLKVYTLEDLESDISLKYNLKCIYCDARVSYWRGHETRSSFVRGHFKTIESHALTCPYYVQSEIGNVAAESGGLITKNQSGEYEIHIDILTEKLNKDQPMSYQKKN